MWKTGCAVQTTVRMRGVELIWIQPTCFRAIRNDLQTKTLPIGDIHAYLFKRFPGGKRKEGPRGHLPIAAGRTTPCSSVTSCTTPRETDENAAMLPGAKIETSRPRAIMCAYVRTHHPPRVSQSTCSKGTAVLDAENILNRNISPQTYLRILLCVRKRPIRVSCARVKTRC